MRNSQQLAPKPDLSSWGHPPATMRSWDEIAAKALMQTAGVPMVPGYHGEIRAKAAWRKRPASAIPCWSRLPPGAGAGNAPRPRAR